MAATKIQINFMKLDLRTQDKKVKLIDVAVPLPVNDPFTYRIAVDMSQPIQVGSRVKIPFRNRTITGYTVAIDVEKEVKSVKDVISVLLIVSFIDKFATVAKSSFLWDCRFSLIRSKTTTVSLIE